MQRIFLILFFAFASVVTATAQGNNSQQGTDRSSIKGVVIDVKTKEPILGATVILTGTSNGAATDFNGEFLIENVPTGNQKIAISYTGYETQTMNVEVAKGLPTQLNIKLGDSPQLIEAVVVTTTRKTNTDIAVLSEIRKVEQIAVGVSAAQIAKTQDRDASAVVKRVPGVSITDDRFVNIRGLAERYNTVLLNDVITPSTEVDVRAFAFDLVPSAAIDRLLVFKSGAAELPGEFAGGIIKIYTKTNADENGIQLGLATAYRTGTTFAQANTYTGSATDALGFDNGLRSNVMNLPDRLVLNDNRAASGAYYAALPNFYSTNTSTIRPDLRANIGYTHNWKLGKQQLSTVTALNYSNTNMQPTEAVQNRYEGTKNDELAYTWTEKNYANNVRVGLMSNWAYTFNANNKLTFRNLFNQIATNEFIDQEGANVIDGIDRKNYAFRYETKSILSSQLGGTHTISDSKLLTWTLGYGFTNRNEPDYRRFTMSRTTGTDNPYQIDVPSTGTPSLTQAARFASNLYESAITGAANYEQKLGNADTKDPIKIRAGVYTESKSRDFVARWFGYINPNGATLTSGTPEQFFAPSNLANNSLYMYEGTNYDDRYLAQSLLTAAYIGATIPFTPQFKAVLGVRGEYYRQQLQSLQRGSGVAINVDNAAITPLPSANFSYQLNDKNALRLAYSYTVNRPEFREIAPFSYYDFNMAVSKTGNPALKSATIQNVDLRYELYPSEGELVTVAAFYKQFTNPIEVVGRAAGSGTSFSYANPQAAVSAGAEIELRKQVIKNLTVVANASYIYSRVDASNLQGQLTNRPLQGQSPYLANLGVFYQYNTWQANLLYNIIGERIYAVGDLLGNQTIYEMPRHQIDFNVSKTIGKNIDVKLGVGDILNQAARLAIDTNENGKIDATDKTWRTYKRGSYLTLGVNAKF